MPRATAGPAPWCWAADGGALALRGGQRLHPVPADAGRPQLHHRRAPAGADGALHPVQQAMVDTPRLAVRLLHAGLRDVAVRPVRERSCGRSQQTQLTPERIDDVLAGNLCRCTGYGPIVAAAQADARAEPGRPDRFAQRGPTRWPGSRRCRRETVCVGADGRRFYAPATADELAELLLEHPEATIVAGATDVGLVGDQAACACSARDLIGARARAAADRGQGADAQDRRRRPLFRRHGQARRRSTPISASCFRRFGGVQVRNAGTIGGNIANGSPIGDSPPALIALGAGSCCAGARARRDAAARGLLHRLRQAGPAAGRVRRGDPGAASRAPGRASRATRWSSASTRTSRPCAAASPSRLDERHGRERAHRLRRHGGHAQARAPRARRRWPARPGTRRRVEAALPALGARLHADRRLARVGRLSCRRSPANLLRRLSPRDHGRATETRLVGDRSAAPMSERIQRRRARARAAPRQRRRARHAARRAYIDDLPEPPGTLHVYLGLSDGRTRASRARP